MKTEVKLPQRGEWWIERYTKEPVRIIKIEREGDPTYQMNSFKFNTRFMSVFLCDFYYEPRCNGFSWKESEEN